MALRLATINDLFACSVMMKNFIQSTDYKDLYDVTYAQEFAKTHLTNPNGVTIVIDNDGLQGMLAAIATNHPFIPVVTTTDLCWWVEPEARGNRQGIELIKAYEYWAIEKKKARLVTLASMNNERVDRIYERLGYTKTEHAWTKRIN